MRLPVVMLQLSSILTEVDIKSPEHALVKP